MSMTATLTNCYVPLPATSSSSSRHLFDPFARIDDNDGDTSLIRKNHNDTTTTATNKTTRGPRTLRRLRLETSILTSSSVSSNNSNGGGSSLVEWGHTKLLVSVRGPRPITASSMTKQHDGSSSGSNGNGVNMVCEVRYMPHVGINIETVALHTLSHDFTTASTTGHKDGSSGSRGGGGGARRVPRDTISTAQDSALLSSGGSPCAPAAFTDETRLSHRLHEALVPAVLLNDTMLCGSGSGGSNKTCIEVFVYILQSDGCVFDAVVTGASLALVNANIPMKDVIVASTAAVVLKSSSSSKEEYIAIADPTEEEILLAKGIVTIALMPNVKEVTVFDQFGKMSLEECTRALELAQSGCGSLWERMPVTSATKLVLVRCLIIDYYS